MMNYAFLRDDEVEKASVEDLELELGGQSHRSGEQSLAEIFSWADAQQSFATSSDSGIGLQSHATGEVGGFSSTAESAVETSQPQSAGGDVNAGGAEAAGAGSAGEAGEKKSDWRSGARAYNGEHAALVEQFNAATNDACGSGGEVDPDKVARWQQEHGVAPDGRVGQRTFHAAKRLSAAKAVKATKEASAGGGGGSSSAAC
jgi:hypothetical protein